MTAKKLKKYESKKVVMGSDTIGAILISIDDEFFPQISLGTSSGGPWLKHSGRVGSVIVLEP